MDLGAVVSLVGSAVVVVSYLRARPVGSAFPPSTDDAPGTAQFLHTARSLTATTWPLVLSIVARGADGGVCVVPSIAWMGLLWCLDVRQLGRERGDDNESVVDRLKQRGVRIEPTVLTALTFGLCGLAGARADSPHTKYVVYALVASILVAMPHVQLPVDDPWAPVVAEVQRAVLMHSIATVVTCVCLTRTGAPAHHA